ncbi:MAG: hypothetical protein P1Q69_13665 [Candidatus Thorarchaeota archaeon]|nr:hypothetical protein [Candidatus Thorarchaeota archaeon]
MSRKPTKTRKGKKKQVGMEAVTEPGYGSLFVRNAWMGALDKMDKKKKHKEPKVLRKRPTDR